MKKLQKILKSFLHFFIFLRRNVHFLLNVVLLNKKKKIMNFLWILCVNGLVKNVAVFRK